VNTDAIPKISVPAHPNRYVITLVGNTIWTIGRGKDNDIVLKDPLISRQHAILQSIAFQDFYLVYFSDLASRNGSFINRRPVQRQQLLVHGDQITIGGATLKFYYPEWTATWDFDLPLS
jgi:adenylate cyclase